jgi:hypothetical protein
MFFKKGSVGGFFKKAVDIGHLGLKAVTHPVVNSALNALAPAHTVTKVANLLQKAK